MKLSVDMSVNELVDDFNNDTSDQIVDEINETGVTKKWQPKEWRIEYEKIVMMDIMGMKGFEIAEKTGYTPQHIYNILGCDEAIAIQKALIGRVRKEGVNIVETLQEIQELTVKRLKDCLRDDNTFKESKLGFISKGIEIMKGTGDYLKNAPTNQVNNTTFQLPPSVADKFLLGLEKSDEARRLLIESKKIEEAEIVDVDS